MTRRERIIASTGLVLGGALLGAAGTIAPGVGIAIAVVGIGLAVQPDEGRDDASDGARDAGPDGDGASR